MLASAISPDGKHQERNQQRECRSDTGGGAIEDKEIHERTQKAIVHSDVCERVDRLARDDTDDLIDGAGGGNSSDHVNNGDEQQDKHDLEDHAEVEFLRSRLRRDDRSLDSRRKARGTTPVRSRGDAHSGRGLAGVLPAGEREDRSRLAIDCNLGGFLRLGSRQHRTLGVAVLATAGLVAGGHRARLGGALNERELSPLFGTETALEPACAPFAGVAVVGVGGVTEGEIAINISLGLASAIIRTRRGNLGGSTVTTFMAATTANVANHFSDRTSTIKRIHRGHEALITGSGGGVRKLVRARDLDRLAELTKSALDTDAESSIAWAIAISVSNSDPPAYLTASTILCS
jgi:hypothetical protein